MGTPLRPGPPPADSAPSLEERRVEAPLARAARRNVQKDEAVKDGELALVDDGQEAAGGVGHEVGGGHLAARDEGRVARGEPQGDEQAPEELDHSRHQHQRLVRHRLPSEGAEELLGAVEGEHRSREEAQESVRGPAEPAENRLHRPSLFWDPRTRGEGCDRLRANGVPVPRGVLLCETAMDHPGDKGSPASRRARQDAYVVKSLVHATQVLWAFESPGEVLRLRDVMDRTRFSKGMCFRLLYTLHHCGFLDKVDGNRYRLV